MMHPSLRSTRRHTVLAVALLLALLPASASVRLPRARLAEASEGTVGKPLRRAESTVRTRARRRLAEDGGGTYISEMLLHRDSALARWPDRRGVPLQVWVQPVAALDDWNVAYVREVRAAFREWDALHLPVRFAFVGDSARADVHVSFVDRFREPISGRTRWVRDDDWWITDGDIMLATHHRTGQVLDADAMRAMTLHEVGHLLGLDHTSDGDNIMAPKVRVRSLSSADRATVRLLYALPPGAIR
ncbi:MAG: peptidase and matrixin and adamalysin [Gemmatimonadetes bacterium]|jgi:hypothetical protein|nr:peptidase and matrixin and adamalysin [Gemmatimonadota bacterium]